MTAEHALIKFGLLLLGAFSLMIILSKSFESSTFFRDIKLTDLLTAAFTAALAVFTWALVNVAGQQTTILEKTDQTLKAAQRPWVSIDPAQAGGDFEFGTPNAALLVAFGLKNYGNSPALNVEMDGEMRVFASGAAINFQALDRQNFICDRLRTRLIGNRGSGFTLVPNEPTIYQNIYFSVAEQEVEKGAFQFSPGIKAMPLTSRAIKLC
jgi:hypothetical protein